MVGESAPSLPANEVLVVMLGVRYWRGLQAVAGHEISRTFIHCTVTSGAIEGSCGSHNKAASNGSDGCRLCHLRRAKPESKCAGLMEWMCSMRSGVLRSHLIVREMGGRVVVVLI